MDGGNKEALRQKLKEIRKNIADKDKKDAAIKNNLEAFLKERFSFFKDIFIYKSLPYEVDTKRFIDDNKDRFNFYFPIVYPDFTMAAGETDFTPDITVTPLIGFNKELHRIGFGKGCYDRFFAVHPKTVKIGLAYCEQYAEFEASEYDIKLDYIITENRILGE